MRMTIRKPKQQASSQLTMKTRTRKATRRGGNDDTIRIIKWSSGFSICYSFSMMCDHSIKQAFNIYFVIMGDFIAYCICIYITIVMDTIILVIYMTTAWGIILVHYLIAYLIATMGYILVCHLWSSNQLFMNLVLLQIDCEYLDITLVHLKRKFDDEFYARWLSRPWSSFMNIIFLLNTLKLKLQMSATLGHRHILDIMSASQHHQMFPNG
jgi:hypothetical protein